jgi:molecular chaperone DnaK
MIYQSEKTLADLGDKLDSADKSNIQEAIEKVRTALKGTDTAAIKNATEELSKAFYAASEKIYSQAQNSQNAQQQGAGPDAGAQGGPQDGSQGQYYDADYEVVDDDKDGSK